MTDAARQTGTASPAVGPDASVVVAVVAPFGDDAGVLCGALGCDAIPCRPATVDGMALFSQDASATQDTGVFLLTEEALGPAFVSALATFQAAQPPWSAPPIILLCDQDRYLPPLTAPLLECRPDTPLTILRRPATRADLLTAVQSARRVRGMQLRTRDLLAERERSEQWSRFLLNELSHRTKNMFSMVLALASQTLRQTRQAPETFMQTYEGRVRTLAEAYSALTRHDWQSATIGDLAEHVVLPLTDQSGPVRRVTMEGPELDVPPATATTLALALHELATNACKYGALSNHTGTVALRWRSDARAGMGELEWRERGGPPVGPPTHKGFGTRVITNAIRSEAGGEAEMLFEPDGLICRLRFQTVEAVRPLPPDPGA